jgi:hypothetical protein
MARNIKETPILTGKEAKEFLNEKKKNLGKKMDPKTKQRIMENYAKINAIAKF